MDEGTANGRGAAVLEEDKPTVSGVAEDVFNDGGGAKGVVSFDVLIPSKVELPPLAFPAGYT
eukprot:11393354-Ditylum_brightwellii.AAC.1